MTRRLRASTAAALAALAGVAAGCWQGPGVDRVRWAVERQLPGARFDPEVHVRFGRLTTGFVHWVVDRALDGEEEDERRAQAVVNAIDRVEVAVWNHDGAAGPEALDAVAMPRSLERMLAQEGWAVLLESRTGGERAWVLTRQDAGAIHALYLVALDASELSVVRLEGRFDEAFVRALSARPGEAAGKILEDSPAGG
jgi:hypothetical protein